MISGRSARILLPLILWLAAAGFVVQGCGSKEEDTNDGPEGGVGEIAGGDHVPPFYLEPVPLTDGDYMPEDFPFEEVAQEALKVDAAEKIAPKFEAEVNGISVYPPESRTDLAARRRCQVAEFVESASLGMSYLPPGTFASSPQFKGICSGGTTSFIMQSFDTKHANFDLIYVPDRLTLDASAPEDRVVAATIRGQPGVIIKPLVEEGFGRSFVAVRFADGLLFVDARNLPLEQSLKIVEGVSCDAC